jgi:hypothetical protein
MNVFQWLSINFLKSQSINTIFLLFVVVLFLIIEFICLQNLHGDFFQLKGFLPERHNIKQKIPHLGGIILISILLISFLVLKINSLVKLMILSKKVLKKDLLLNLWGVSTKFNESYFLLNHYLSNIGLILI